MDENDTAPQSQEQGLSRRAAFMAAVAGAAGASMMGVANAADAAPMPLPEGSNFGQAEGDKDMAVAWAKFCDRLKDAGGNVFKKTIAPDPLVRADAFRFMLQNLGQSFMLGFETKDTKFPSIYTFCSPWFKLGGDNADCVYQQAWIDGESVYKISGNRGQCRYFSIVAQGPKLPANDKWHPLMDPFGDVPEASILGTQLVTDWDGNFELYVGGPKQGPNWLPTTPGTRKLFIRQYFDDIHEEAARIRIERVGMTDPRAVPKPGDIVKALDWMTTFNYQNSIDWPDWAYAYASDMDPVHINKFPSTRRTDVIRDPSYNEEKDKIRARSGIAMRWRLQPDEAMILEFDHKNIFWMLTNMGMMLNSMDYLYRPISWTPSRTKVDKDNKVRFVMCAGDPGYHNWIDTSGLTEGFLENRNIYTVEFTDIRTKVVKKTELAKLMPKDSAMVTAEERTKLMVDRFHAISKRYML